MVLEARHGSIFINDEIFIEILRRLPMKSLVRFRCVSKAWRGFISSPYFHMRANVYMPMAGLIVLHGSLGRQYEYCKDNDIDGSIHRIMDAGLSSMPHYPNISLVDSCNGLLLYFTGAYPELYNVYNPTTRARVVLPLPSRIAILEAAGLAFDPRVSPHFKVVFISRNVSQELLFEIFSSKNGKWVKRLETYKAPRKEGFLRKKHVFVGGALYIETPWRTLIRFDFEEESFRELQLHPDTGENYLISRIGECRGKLQYAEYVRSHGQMRIWTLEEGNRKYGWLQRHFDIGRLFSPVKVVAFHPILDEVLFLRIDKQIWRYHLRTKDWKEICKFTDGIASMKDVEVFPVSPCYLHYFHD